MKQHLNPVDLNELTEGQKQVLRDLWIPEKYDLVVAYICSDAEMETYDEIVFVVGDVLIEEINQDKRKGISKSPTHFYKYHSVVLRSLRLLDDKFYEENARLFDNEGDFDLEYSKPEDFFSKDDCLPLLNAGQLIELIQKTKYGVEGFSMDIPDSKAQDDGFTVNSSYYGSFSADNICDALWSVLKQAL